MISGPILSTNKMNDFSKKKIFFFRFTDVSNISKFPNSQFPHHLAALSNYNGRPFVVGGWSQYRPQSAIKTEVLGFNRKWKIKSNYPYALGR